jgi:hypothetical protein
VANGQRPGEENGGPLSLVVIIVTLAVAVFLSQSNYHPWIKFVGCLVDAIIVVLGAPWLRSRAKQVWDDWARPKIEPLPDGWWRITAPFSSTRARAILAGVIAVVLVAAVIGMVTARDPGPAVAAGCPEPREVRILTSTDGQEWARELFDAYARFTAVAPAQQDRMYGAGCPAVHPVVYSAATAAAISALAASWGGDGRESPLRTIGPRPDLWLPDASTDVAAMLTLAQRSGYQLPLPISSPPSSKRIVVTPGAVTSTGTSPIIIARRGDPAAPPVSGQSWPEALTAATGGGAGLVAADPNVSTTGQFAMASYLRDNAELVGPALARQRVQATAGSVGGGAVTSLCAAGRDPHAAAVITSSQLWQLYGAGGRLSAACPGGPPTFGGWTAVPRGEGLILDHPLVVPTWTLLDPPQSRATQAIKNWLNSQDGRTARDNAELDIPRDCLATDEAFVATACVPVDPQAAKRLYDAAKSPGRVLMVMDASGSMGGPAAGGGTRLTVARAAFTQALGQIGPEDEVGLWTFPRHKDRGQKPYDMLVDLGVGTAKLRVDAAAKLGGVKPGGGTPLYQAIVDGFQRLGQAGVGGGRTSALVVLTDGQDTSSGRTMQQIRATIEAKHKTTGVRLFVVAIGEAGCEGAQGLEALTEGLGACLDAQPDQISGTMAQLFESLWKGQ